MLSIIHVAKKNVINMRVKGITLTSKVSVGAIEVTELRCKNNRCILISVHWLLRERHCHTVGWMHCKYERKLNLISALPGSISYI